MHVERMVRSIEWNYTYTHNYTFILIHIIIPITIPDPGVIICIIPRWYNYIVIIHIIIPPNRIPKCYSLVESRALVGCVNRSVAN